MAPGWAEVTLRTPARLPLILERRMTLDAGRPVLRLEEAAGDVVRTGRLVVF